MPLALTHLVNLFLDEKKIAEVQTLSSKKTFGSKEEAVLQNLVSEGLRKSVSGPFLCVISNGILQVLILHSKESIVGLKLSRVYEYKLTSLDDLTRDR